MMKKFPCFLLLLALLSSVAYAASMPENEALQRAKKIKVIVVQQEGVLTNNVYLNAQDGETFYKYSLRDTRAIETTDIPVFIINIKNSRDTFGINDYVKRKIESIRSQKMVSENEIAFITSQPDEAAALKMCGLACCPQDAPAAVKELCAYVAPTDVEKGVLADVIDFINKARETRY